MKSYLIEYEVLSSIGACIHHGKIKVKNQKDGIGAQINLEKKLKRDVPHFHKMVVLSIDEQEELNNDILDFFNGIFK